MKSRGFTLVEVLIALVIVSVALAAAMRATAMAVTSADEAKRRTYAQWVAHNRAAELVARRAFPPVGRENGTAEMGGLQYAWSQEVNETPNTAFRKVALQVTEVQGADTRTLATLFVYLARPQ